MSPPAPTHWGPGTSCGPREGASPGFSILSTGRHQSPACRVPSVLPSPALAFTPAETSSVFPSSPVPRGHGVLLSRAMLLRGGSVLSAVPGAGPRGGMYQLLCPWLHLPPWPLLAQRQLPTPHSGPLPDAQVCLRTGSSGSPQLVSHQSQGKRWRRRDRGLEAPEISRCGFTCTGDGGGRVCSACLHGARVNESL